MADLLGMEVEMTDVVTLSTGDQQRPGFVVPGARGGVARDGNVHYCPSPVLRASHLRGILISAGVHIYLDTGDPVMAGGGYIAVHAASEGIKRIRNRRVADWRNARTGKLLIRRSPELCIRMRRAETLILRLESPSHPAPAGWQDQRIAP
jgi:hypothetical protein